MKNSSETIFVIFGSTALWTALSVWWLDLGWMGGLLIATISFPYFYWLVRREHRKERLKKLDKIEKAAEINKR